MEICCTAETHLGWPQEKLHSLKPVLLLWMFKNLMVCAGTTMTVSQYVGLMSSPKDLAVVEGLQLWNDCSCCGSNLAEGGFGIAGIWH